MHTKKTKTLRFRANCGRRVSETNTKMVDFPGSEYTRPRRSAADFHCLRYRSHRVLYTNSGHSRYPVDLAFLNTRNVQGSRVQKTSCLLRIIRLNTDLYLVENINTKTHFRSDVSYGQKNRNRHLKLLIIQQFSQSCAITTGIISLFNFSYRLAEDFVGPYYSEYEGT